MEPCPASVRVDSEPSAAARRAARRETATFGARPGVLAVSSKFWYACGSCRLDHRAHQHQARGMRPCATSKRSTSATVNSNRIASPAARVDHAAAPPSVHGIVSTEFVGKSRPRSVDRASKWVRCLAAGELFQYQAGRARLARYLLDANGPLPISGGSAICGTRRKRLRQVQTRTRLWPARDQAASTPLEMFHFSSPWRCGPSAQR